MNYEEKYKQALERARQFSEHPLQEDSTNIVEYIFPELKESEDEQSRKWILEYLYDGLRKADEQFKPQFKSAIAWLEKQGEKDLYIDCTNDKGCVTRVDGNMKETSKPKFKVGDWVVYNYHNTVSPVSKIILIDKVVISLCDTNSLYFQTEINDLNCNYHLWTIHDAKDGDVLVSSQGRPFIFSGKYDDINSGEPIAYCGVNCQNKFKIGNGTHWTNKNEVAPATKEQCDQLFAKMRESGYEWDAEKKELKKIEPKKLDADKVVEWMKTHGKLVPIVTIKINDVIAKFKKDFGL